MGRPCGRGIWPFTKAPWPRTVTDATFARLTDPHATERGAFVAELDGTVAGFVHYIYHAHNWHAGDVCYLQDLYVSDTARGNGAARA